MRRKIKIKSIILENKTEVNVEQILDDEDGIKFYITEQIRDNFDIRNGMIQTIPLYMIKVKTMEDKIYTLFNCFYTVREEGKLYVHLVFNEIVRADVDKRNFECNKLIVEFDENISKRNTFLEDVNFWLNDINISHVINKNEVIIASNSNKDTEELFSYFADYFELINIIIGYFPIIIQTTYELNSRKFIVENEVVNKYCTDNKYKENIFLFLKNLNGNDIREAYMKYREFSKKALLQLSMYFIATMEKKSYIEVDVVNILQTLEGLYGKLAVFENQQKEFSDEMNCEVIDLINDIDFSELKEKYSNTSDINKKISGCISRMNYFSYRKKLNNIFGYNDYLLFEEEKKKDNNPFIYYDIFIEKCINSRNKFSHVDEKENYLFEDENIVYIYKLILIFRLLVLQEIGLDSKISMIDLKEYLNSINNYIRKVLPI